MGRLRVLSGREVCRILQQHGFAEVRRKPWQSGTIWGGLVFGGGWALSGA